MQPVQSPPPFVTFNHKDILLRKCYFAVISTILSHLTFIFVYLIFININLSDLSQWQTSILNTLTSLSTWIFIIVTVGIMLAQCIVCAKDYVFTQGFYSTRIQQWLYMLSFHNASLLLLHMSIGGLLVWQLLYLVDSDRSLLTTKCSHSKYCFSRNTLALIVSGFWTGFYYFSQIYIRSKYLMFPIIPQKKIAILRYNLRRIAYDSCVQSIRPSLYFIGIYMISQGYVKTYFGVEINNEQAGFLEYIHIVWLGGLYCFNMSLIRLYFEIFLTEPVTFPVSKHEGVLTLQEALTMNEMPIIQHLACYDLLQMAKWSVERRQELFSLSNIGAHPHNWNTLVNGVLKIFEQYTNLLEVVFKDQNRVVTVQHTERCLDKRQYSNNLRNMSMPNPCIQNVSVLHHFPNENINITNARITSGGQQLVTAWQQKWSNALNLLRKLFGFDYFFGEIPQVNIQKCLTDANIIMWTSEGIVDLLAMSLHEDRYGVAQKDVHCILISLIKLKQNFDKLNHLPSGQRKSYYLIGKSNRHTQSAISTSLKRSLFVLCKQFGTYFNDFRISREAVAYLQSNVTYKLIEGL